MKGILNFVFVGILALGLFSCATTQPQKAVVAVVEEKPAAESVKATPFVPLDSEIAVWGEGFSADKDPKIAREVAYNDAYGKLAQNMEVQVKGYTQNVLQANLNDEKDRTAIMEGLNRTVYDKVLKGNKYVEERIVPKTNQYWVRVSMSKSEVTSSGLKELKSFKENLLKQAMLEDKLQGFIDELDSKATKENEKLKALSEAGR